MNTPQTISKEKFIKRFTDLCLRSGLPGFPKDEIDQHILLKSAVLTFGHPGGYTEKEINDTLDDWITRITQIKTIDRVTLRRRLVDTGYLLREKDGSRYHISPGGSGAVLFDEAVDQINLMEAIAAAREEMARRKREYLEKSRGQANGK